LVGALSGSHEVVQLDVKEPDNPAQCALGKVVAGSILDGATVAEALDGVDTVVHAAAIPGNHRPFVDLIQINEMGTLTLLEACGDRHAVEQFVYISSVCWHGLLDDPLDETMPRFLPITEDHPSVARQYYGFSKVQAEAWCRFYTQRYKKPAVAVRPAWIVQSDEDHPLEARPAADRPRLHDYVAVADLVDGIARAIEYEPPDGFDRFLFNGDEQYSMTPSLELAARYFPGIPADEEKLSACDGFGALVDCSHAKEALDWRPVVRCRR